MIASQLMIAFAGMELPPDVDAAISARPFAGVTLFRHHNVSSAAQVRALTDALQAAAARGGHGPLLIAADQETGQLVGAGDDTTHFAGAMALGAAADPDLAERVARATAIELRALGINVNYAPVCDLATNPLNPGLGIRCFGDDPSAVAELAAATVRGFQSEGVAATVKHFPGAGEAAVDTHHELAVVEVDRQLLRQRELAPFRAAIAAGARLAMAGHFALPSVTDDPTLPASLAAGAITGLLRDELGFEGLAITDALDMHALAQGAAQVVDVICAVRAGQDLLLGTADAELIRRLEEGLEQAARRGLTDAQARRASATRLDDTRAWLASFGQAPPLEDVGCAEHLALADELAQRSITLVRNEDGLLPLRLAADSRVAVVQPQPADMTPADTSSFARPLLAEAVRRRHWATDEYVVDSALDDSEAEALASRLAGYDLIVLGTVAANLVPAHAAFARRVLSLGRPTVTVALRTPWDIYAYPEARTHVCTYGLLAPTMQALGAALFGEAPFRGTLPVEIYGLHARGHGLT